MKCLTVQQPWAHAIIHLGKDVENRTWRTDYRGPLAIHAGMKFDQDGGRRLEQRGHDMLVDMPGGFIVGVVDLVDCVFNMATRRRDMHPEASAWGEPGTFHWLLSNPRPLAEPIPYRGKLGLFTLDGPTAARVAAGVQTGSGR